MPFAFAHFSHPHSAETTESELCRVFSAYGNVKSTKIIVDRAGVSKGYGFVTFDTPAVIDSLMVRHASDERSRTA